MPIRTMARRGSGIVLVGLMRVVTILPMVLKPMMVVLVMAVAVLVRAMRMMSGVAALPAARPRRARSNDATSEHGDGDNPQRHCGN